jgi:hypothetical protein
MLLGPILNVFPVGGGPQVKEVVPPKSMSSEDVSPASVVKVAVAAVTI